LPDKICQFKCEYPGVQIRCTLGNTAEICTGTASGLFDLGFVEGEVKSTVENILEQSVVGSDRLIIVVGKSHPWFRRTKVSIAELIDTAWIVREAGAGTRSVFEQTLRQWGIEPERLNVILEMSSGEMVKAAVESGMGAAAISELMVKKELQLKSLRSVPVNNPVTKLFEQIARPFLKLKHRQRFQTRLSQAFEQMLTVPKS
jgi:DNA-binding transcriptional LysR family regulator